MNSKTLRHAREAGACLALYAGLVLISAGLLRSLQPAGVLRHALVMLPMLGVAGFVWVMLRYLRRVDEMQRRAQLDALGMAFAGTAFVTMAWGFAETAGAPKLPTFAILPLMSLLWMAGAFIAYRRYGQCLPL